MHCPHCGKEIPDQSHYCLYCMQSLKEPVAVQPVPVSRRHGRLLLILIAGIVAVGAAAGIFLLTKNTLPEQEQTLSAVSSSFESSDSAAADSGTEADQQLEPETEVGEYIQTNTGGKIFDTGSVEWLTGADQEGFLVEDGVLVQYSGTDTVVEVPQGVTTIGQRAFFNNQAISEVVLPEGLISIETSAFYGCTALKKIELPATLSQVDSQAFSMCTSLTEHVISEDNPYFAVKDGVLFNQEGTVLSSYPAGKTGSEYTVPDTVTMIVGWAFEGNPYLESVSLPAGLSDTYCPFGYCSALREINVEEGNPFFVSQDGVLFSGDGGMLLYYPPSKEGTELDIPQTVTGIESNAFLGNRYLNRITIPEGVSTLTTFVFKEAEQLQEVYLPSTITVIDSYAFYNMRTVPTVYTPENSVTETFCQENGIPCQIVNE